MKNLNKLATIAITLVIASCSTTRKQVSSDTIEIEKTNVITKPQLADVEIESRKIDGFAEVKKKDYMPNPLEACKSLALKDATNKGKCDLVVQPMYETEEDSRYIRVKVTGFAGSYKKFREIVAADTTTFIAYGKIKNAVNADFGTPKSVKKETPFSRKNGGKGAGAAAGIGVAGLLLLLLLL